MCDVDPPDILEGLLVRDPDLTVGLVHRSFCDAFIVLLRHEFLRRDGSAIGALQQGHRDRVLTRAPISRRRMVAIEFGM